MGNYDQLREAVKLCRACPLGARGNGVPGRYVGPSVNSHRDLMIIGEAPGGSEQYDANTGEYGRPFIGQAGDLLQSLLQDCNVTNYYLTNIAKHQPWKKNGKQEPPDSTAIIACSPALEMEFKLVRPKKLILLGKVAAKTILQLPGNPGVGDLVNRAFPVPGREGVEAVVLYHPSFFLHNRTASFTNKQMNEWKRAVRAFLGAEIPHYPIEKVECHAHG